MSSPASTQHTSEQRQHGMRVAIGLVTLMGAVFTGFALMAVVRLILGPRQAWNDIVGYCTVAGTFGSVGGLLLLAVVYLWRKQREEARLRARYPGQPWLHRLDWSEQRSQHVLTLRACLLAGGAIAGNCMCLGISCLYLMQPAAQPGMQQIGVFMILASFDLIMLCFIAYAITVALAARSYQRLVCELVSHPFRPGAAIRCLIYWPGPTLPKSTLFVELNCVTSHSVAPKNQLSIKTESHTYQKFQYQARYLVESGWSSQADDVQFLPVRFEIPAAAPETCDSNACQWRLSLSWLSGRMAHCIDFDLPVFTASQATRDTELEQRFDTACAVDAISGHPAGARLESLAELVESYHGTFIQPEKSQWTLTLPITNTWQWSSGVTLVAAVIIFAGGGLAVGGWLGVVLAAMPWAAILNMRPPQLIRANKREIHYTASSFWGAPPAFTGNQFNQELSVGPRRSSSRAQRLGLHQGRNAFRARSRCATKYSQSIVGKEHLSSTTEIVRLSALCSEAAH